MRHRWKRLVVLALSAALVLLAFARGNHLLGTGYGVVFAFIVGGILYLITKPSVESKKDLLLRIVVFVLLLFPLSFILSFPALANPDLQHFIDKQALDRAARAELTAVFASNSAFADLSISTLHVKVVNVTIHGSLDDRSDLDRLRDRILHECPTVKQCPLHWDVMLRNPPQRLDGPDTELFDADG